MKWVKKYEVPRSSGEGVWVVSQSETEEWGCGCPVWKFGRNECKHIKAVKGGEYDEVEGPNASIVFANVREVKKDKNGNVLVPLIPIDDTHFAATVYFDLYVAGVPWRQIKGQYGLARKNTKKAILNYVRAKGRKIYGSVDKETGRNKEREVTNFFQMPDLPKNGESPEEYCRRTGYPMDLKDLVAESLRPGLHLLRVEEKKGEKAL